MSVPSCSVANLFSLFLSWNNCHLLKGMCLLSWMALPGKTIPAALSLEYLSSTVSGYSVWPDSPSKPHALESDNSASWLQQALFTISHWMLKL